MKTLSSLLGRSPCLLLCNSSRPKSDVTESGHCDKRVLYFILLSPVCTFRCIVSLQHCQIDFHIAMMSVRAAPLPASFSFLFASSGSEFTRSFLQYSRARTLPFTSPRPKPLTLHVAFKQVTSPPPSSPFGVSSFPACIPLLTPPLPTLQPSGALAEVLRRHPLIRRAASVSLQIAMYAPGTPAGPANNGGIKLSIMKPTIPKVR